MTVKIGIQHDEVIHANGERQSYSERWADIASTFDITPVWIDTYAPGAVEAVRSCDAFMWRYDPSLRSRQRAHRFLYAAEFGLNLPVFPSLRTRWHVEDKILQAEVFSAMSIPHPRTWVFRDPDSTEHFIETAEYPFVLKLSSGYRSSNVRLIESRAQARAYAQRLFGDGVFSLASPLTGPVREVLRRGRRTFASLHGRNVDSPADGRELHYGYFLAQEFVDSNDFDVRVTVVGHRAYAFRRFNRPNDFRASGSGLIDWAPEKIDDSMIRAALKLAQRLGAQTVAVDFLEHDNSPLILELTLTYASWAVNRCPGYWFLANPLDADSDIQWSNQPLRCEDAVLQDFIGAIRGRSKHNLEPGGQQQPMQSFCDLPPELGPLGS
ncbi:MAG: hypothetical protein FKY71_10970 [Spiribacter salinus]|uniref:ATP-grasp domain-containing protein n=1 Tax=Spiribacter salinus TaxID=1335746 RepID=A0A540VQH4_9GAMM|nr:MAG: hypothetical protein FKY71_10970 [Spiribacter salinus]